MSANPFEQSSGEKVAGSVPESIPLHRPDKSLKTRFERLVQEWKAERNPYSSDPARDATCLSYLKIIGIGPEAIPLILTELRRCPDHWFIALHALTDVDPVSQTHRGNFREVTSDWIAWGKDNGYIS